MSKKTNKNKKISFWEVLSIIGKVLGAIISVFFFIMFLLLFIGIMSFFVGEEIETGNVALIPIEGTISAGESMIGSSAKSSDIIELIEKAEEDEKIKAIVFEINSTGGGPVATDEIASKIKNCEKPTISLIRETGASGGFWIATSAEKVYANRMSITGSIGVTSARLTFPEFIKEYNITYRKLTAGKYKDAGTIWRDMTEEEKEMFQKELDYVHEEFIKGVAENRNMTYEEVEKYADGFIFTGKEAKEYGFVDELGNLNDVKEYLEEKYDIEVKFKKMKTKKGFAEVLGGVATETSFNIGKGIGNGLVDDEAKVSV